MSFAPALLAARARSCWGGILLLLMSSLISALLFLWLATAWHSVAVITLALALVVVKLDALGVAQISDSLKGLALLDIVVADVELGQRSVVLWIAVNNSSSTSGQMA